MMDRSWGRRIFISSLVVLAIALGIIARQWTWAETRHVRFTKDIVNGFYWGGETLAEARKLSVEPQAVPSWPDFLRGYHGLYDRVRRDAYQKEYLLDYPPLRLLVMSIWARGVQQDFPGARDVRVNYVKPLLRFNLFCELASVLGVFLLTRRLVDQASGSTCSPLLHRISPQNRGWMCGAAAALTAWFDPSMILDAHGWPQWDVWILPFYLFAVMAATTRRWFWCGCLLALGAMLKGQLLFVAPFFIIWPLWQKRWDHALLVLSGFITATALVTAQWLLSNWQVGLAAALAALAIWSFLLWRRPNHLWKWGSGLTAAAIIASAAAFHGDFAWLRIGFLYGTERYPYLFVSSCYNLPSLLATRGWSLKDPFFAMQLGDESFSLNLQWTLRLLYLGALIFCAWAAARHSRYRDPRLLIAVAAPWLVMFALLGQMHERYLLWGGVVSALALGVSLRTAFVSLLFSLASTSMILHVMLLDKKLPATMPAIDLLNRIQPYAAVLILACVALFLWEMGARGPLFRRPARRSETREPILLGAAPEQV